MSTFLINKNFEKFLCIYCTIRIRVFNMVHNEEDQGKIYLFIYIKTLYIKKFLKTATNCFAKKRLIRQLAKIITTITTITTKTKINTNILTKIKIKNKLLKNRQLEKLKQ